MKGCIVYNHSLDSKSYTENISLFSKQTHLPAFSNKEMCFIHSYDFDYCIFLDKDIALAKYLENKNIKVYNSSSTIEMCDNKAYTFIAVNNKISIPHTVFSPLSYFEPVLLEPLSYPFVAKECYGSWGKQVHLVRNLEEYKKIVNSFNNRPYIIQEYIEAEGTDYRLYTIGGKVVACIQRKNNYDFRANCELGGVASVFTPTDEMVNVAEKVSKELCLDFGGIDLILDKENNIYFIEANSSAQAVQICKTTGVNIPSLLLEYIKNNLTFN